MSKVQRRYGWHLAVAFALVATLAPGCGGGGGDGGGGAAPTPPAGSSGEAALRLDTGNFYETSTEGLRAVETLLGLGQYVANEVALVARHGAPQIDLPCTNTGTAAGAGRIQYTLQDVDGNRVPSAGDSITVRYTGCYVDFLGANIQSGTLTIRLATVSDAEHGAVSGTLDFGAGLVSAQEADGYRMTWLGSMQFRRSETTLREELSVSASSADDFRQSIRQGSPNGPVTQVVAYQRPSLTRVLDRPAARASVTGSLRLASERLGGRVDINLEPQLSAYFDTVADSGSVRIAGASNSRITLAPGAGTDNGLARAELDANGDGTTDSTLSLAWRVLHRGFLWVEENWPSGLYGAHSPLHIELLSQPDWDQTKGWDVSRPLRFQFDRPLASNTTLYAKLTGGSSVRGSEYGDSSPNTLGLQSRTIEADVRVHGAVVLIEPREPLAWGLMYQVLLSDRSDFSSGALLRDSTGTARAALNVQLTSFNTADMLWPAVAGAGVRSLLLPGRSITVSATAPFATALPLRWRWTQVSGPPLLLDTPDAASTAVRLAAGTPTGVGRAVLQLTLTDALGRSASSQVALQLANPEGMNTLLYLAVSASESSLSPPHSHLYSPQTGQFTATGAIEGRNRVGVAYRQEGSNDNWNVDLAAPGGVAPAVGAYTGAWDLWSLLNGNTAQTPMLSVYGGLACNSHTGRFQVLDIAFDNSGQLQRLAVDFEQPCNVLTNSPRTVRGALRINSPLAFTP